MRRSPDLRVRRGDGQGSAAARRAGRLALLGALLGALALRLPGVPASPLAFHPVRQYTGLAVARAQYFAWENPKLPSVVLVAVEKTGRAVPRLEPRLIESVVAAGYLLLGDEHRGVGGALSSLVWVGGGVFLYLLARRLASALAAGVALAFHLFLPYGIIASRSVQHDPTMVTLMLAALLAIVRHHEKPTTGRLAACAALSSLAILVKPVCVFFLVGAFFALAVRRRGLRHGLLQPAAAVFLAVALLPSGLPYVHRLVTRGGVASHYASVALAPTLLLEPTYWRGWYRMVDGTVGVVMALIALAAVFVARERRARAFMAGVMAGYVVFGLVFTYHIHTHDYYQLAFIPIVGLGVGLTVDAAVARIRRSEIGPAFRTAFAVAAIVLVASAGSAVVRSSRPLPAGAVDGAIAATERIGELVSHSDRVIVLATAHGWPLRYHGVLAGPGWPYAVLLDSSLSDAARARNASDRLDEMVADGAEWFVITELDELTQQPELRALLDQRASLAAEGRGHLVYDLRSYERTDHTGG